MLIPEETYQIPPNADSLIQIILPDPSTFKENPEEPIQEVFLEDEFKEEKEEDHIEEERIQLEDKEDPLALKENEIDLEILENLQEMGRNPNNNKKKYSKQNLRTYQDLVSIIHNKSSCEWQESRYSLPSKMIFFFFFLKKVRFWLHFLKIHVWFFLQ